MNRFVLGDIQGHSDAFKTTLRRLDIDPATGQMRAPCLVVQAGDLIHKGPNSDEVVATVDRLIRSNPDRWIQLMGNHEGQYLGGPVFWPTMIGEAAATTLATWLIDGMSRIAFGLDDGTTNTLVTHGGLTVAKWRALGSPTSARDAAQLLNEEFLRDPVAALIPGVMLRGETGPPGVAWSEPIFELYGPWAEHGSPPFEQIHGHASMVDWRSGRPRRGTPRWMRKLLTFDATTRRSEIRIGARSFVGIDTAFGASDIDPVLTAHPF